jgi:PAS domain S-box-containing protein
VSGSLSYDELLEKLKALEKQSAECDLAKLALENSEAKYRAIVEAFDGFIYICSQEFRIEFANRHLIERTGGNPLGELCYKALHGRESVCPWCVNERILKGETVRWEIQSPLDKRWYFVVNAPIRLAGGKISKQAMILDVTDRKRMEQLLEARRQILEMVATRRDLQEILDSLNSTIEQLAPGTFCSILLLDQAGERLFHRSAPSLPQEFLNGINGFRIGPNAGSCGTAAYRGTPVIVEDIDIDPLWEKARDLARRCGLRACWSVPIRNSTGKVLGTFALYDREPRRPSPEDLRLVESAAHLAGIAIEREQSERALRESEVKYRSLFQDSLDAIYATSRDGTFADANQATLDLFGYSKEELLNEVKVSQIYRDSSDMEKFRELVEREGSIRNFEVRLLKKDGSQIDCLLTSSKSCSEQGEVLGYHGIIRDVTESKLAREALLESEARYRAIVEDQTELICRFLPGGTITFVNEAYTRYFHRSREDLIGTGCMQFIPPDEQGKVEGFITALSPENPVAAFEHRVVSPTGEVRWQQWTIRIILDERRGIVEHQAVGRDITERKLMEEALRKSAEKIKLFAYSVSHDLKSPTVGIHGLTKLLHRRYGHVLDDQGRTYCDQILRTAEHIGALVDKINLYISAKEAPLHIETVDLKEVFRTLRDEFAPRLQTRGIAWVQPREIPEIKCDRLAVLRMLSNLVDNALKHAGTDLSEIKMGYEDRAGSHYIFSVSDDGKGISPESSRRIFDPFQRQPGSGNVEGLGLGLAIVKEIADQHGGEVWVEPRLEGGTRFCVSISKDLA